MRKKRRRRAEEVLLLLCLLLALTPATVAGIRLVSGQSNGKEGFSTLSLNGQKVIQILPSSQAL